MNNLNWERIEHFRSKSPFKDGWNVRFKQVNGTDSVCFVLQKVPREKFFSGGGLSSITNIDAKYEALSLAETKATAISQTPSENAHKDCCDSDQADEYWSLSDLCKQLSPAALDLLAVEGSEQWMRDLAKVHLSRRIKEDPELAAVAERMAESI